MKEKYKETSPPELPVQPLTKDHLADAEAILRQNITVQQVDPVETEIKKAVKKMESYLEDPSGFPQYVVVTDSNGRVTGVMGLNTVNEKLEGIDGIDETTLEIINAYTNPTTQHRNIGVKLLSVLIALAQSAGFRKIAVVSGSRYKEKGHPFWTKHFGEPKELKDYYDQDIDANLWLYDIPILIRPHKNSDEIKKMLQIRVDAAVEAYSGPDGPTKEDVRTRYSEDNIVISESIASKEYSALCAEIGGLIVGMCVWHQTDSKTVNIDYVYVKPKYQGEGIGRLLINEVLEQIGDKTKIQLSTQNAQGFYEKFGFVVDKGAKLVEDSITREQRMTRFAVGSR